MMNYNSENVMTDPEVLDRYKTDEETDPHYHHLPEVVVAPANTEEVAAVMKIANEFDVPVTPRSAGTSVSCGAVPVCGGIVMLMERMDKILELNKEGMYMVVEAGARTLEIQEYANKEGFSTLPPTPAATRLCATARPAIRFILSKRLPRPAIL